MVAIVIITHKRAEKLKRLLASLKRYTSQEHSIYVLDNGGTLDYTNFCFIIDMYKVKFFKSESNWYPGKARNFLFDQLENEKHVVTLDDDMIVAENWLNNLFKALKAIPQCAGASPRIIQASTNRIHSQGGYYKIKDNYYITFTEHFIRQPINTKSAPYVPCDWLASGCTLYPRAIVDEFRFDEDMPNMEDPLHSYEIKKAGHNLVSTPTSVITHSAGKTANAVMRINDALTKGICYFHQKTGLNPIKSWSMHTRLLRGAANDRAHTDRWLHYNKIKFGIIPGSIAKVGMELKKHERNSRTLQPVKTTRKKGSRTPIPRPSRPEQLAPEGTPEKRRPPLSYKQRHNAAYRPGAKNLPSPRKKPLPARYKHFRKMGG